MSEEKNEATVEGVAPGSGEAVPSAAPEAVPSTGGPTAGADASATEIPSEPAKGPEAAVDPSVPETPAASADAAERIEPSVEAAAAGGEATVDAERTRAADGVEGEDEGAPRPGFRPQAQGAEAEQGQAEQGADAARPGPSPDGERTDETPGDDAGPRPSDGVEEENAQRPSFRRQGMPEEEPKERPAGSTGLIRRSNLADRDPGSADNVKDDFLLMLSDSSDPEMFQGKRMTVTLGFKSKYIFDGDKVAKVMRHGAVVKQMEVPDDIVVGRVNDDRTDPLKIVAAQKLREARNRGNIDAVAIQAAAVLKAREAGSTQPTPISPVLSRFNTEKHTTAAAIVGERLDALNDADLKAFAEKRTGDVSIAASRLMTFGIESPDAQRAAEFARDAGAAPDVDPSAPAPTAARENAGPEADTASGAAPATPSEPEAAGSSEPQAAAPSPEPAASTAEPSAQAPDEARGVETAPVQRSGATPEATGADDVASGADRTPVEAAPPVGTAAEPSRPVLTLRGPVRVVEAPQAAPSAGIDAATPAANDAAPRTLKDQARMVTVEGLPESRSKGNEAANDASNVIALADRSKGRD